jgi:hypothetical protein
MESEVSRGMDAKMTIITRLEDLRQDERDAIIVLVEDGEEMEYKIWDRLLEIGLVDIDLGDGHDFLTPAGRALYEDWLARNPIMGGASDPLSMHKTYRGERAALAEYQREDEARTTTRTSPPTLEKRHLFERIQDILDIAEFHMPGELTEDKERVRATIEEFRYHKALMDKELAEMKAENERLQKELAAAKAWSRVWKFTAMHHRGWHHIYDDLLYEMSFGLDIIPELDTYSGYVKRVNEMKAEIEQLRVIKQKVEAFIDDYGDWSPKQRQIPVSPDAIKTLMNVVEALKDKE